MHTCTGCMVEQQHREQLREPESQPRRAIALAGQAELLETGHPSLRRGVGTQGECDALHEDGGVDHMALEPLEPTGSSLLCARLDMPLGLLLEEEPNPDPSPNMPNVVRGNPNPNPSLTLA